MKHIFDEFSTGAVMKVGDQELVESFTCSKQLGIFMFIRATTKPIFMITMVLISGLTIIQIEKHWITLMTLRLAWFEQLIVINLLSAERVETVINPVFSPRELIQLLDSSHIHMFS